MLIKTIFVDSRNIKRIRNYVSKRILISLFLDIAKFADFQKKDADVSRNQGVCHAIHRFFESFLGKV